jgi:magnesium transporter
VGAVSREESIDWDRCDVVIGEGFLLTLHRGPSAVLAVVRRDYEHDFQKFAKTSSFLIYEIWNAQINQFIALEGELEHDVESVRVALHHEVNETTLDRLSHMSAKLMVLRKRVLPARRVLEELVSRKTALISDATLEFFGTMIGTLDRLLADIDANREILESAVNLSLTFTAHRTNLTMNRLAVVSTIFLPLTFLCGVYGMNFEVLPEVRWVHGYTYFWVLSAIITIVLVVLLRRLRLL